MRKPTITLAFDEHRNRGVVSLRFDKDFELINKVKTIPGTTWSQSRRFWYINKDAFDLHTTFEVLKPVAYLDYSAIKQSASKPEENTGKQKKEKLKPILSGKVNKKIESFRLWMEQSRYRPNTIDTYIDALRTFFGFFNRADPASLTNDDLIEFNKSFIIQRNYSPSYQNQVINAIKLFYTKELKHAMIIDEIERPIRRKPLPKVLAKATIKEMLAGISNLKHKTALTLVYGLGLRRGEILRMEISHIDFKRKTVMILNSKGGNDRPLPLSEKLIRMIKQQLTAYEPMKYVIEGKAKGKPYSPTSLSNIFEKNLTKVIGEHKYSLHCLRHSYATHLLEAGVDIRYIQELLGHKSSRTTEIYTHVSMKNLSNIKNPTDDFDI